MVDGLGGDFTFKLGYPCEPGLIPVGWGLVQLSQQLCVFKDRRIT